MTARSLERMPSRFELSVALEVARLVSADGVDDQDLIVSFEHMASGGLVRVDHLTAATKLLTIGGLLTRKDDRWQAVEVLKGVGALSNNEGIASLAFLLLSRAPPIWVAGATVGAALNVDVIPDADWKSLCDAIADPHRREAMILCVGRRLMGNFGIDVVEAAVASVLEECRRRLITFGRPDLGDRILRVASEEQLGYDIVCPTIRGECWRLRVLAGHRGLSRLAMNITRTDIGIGIGKSGWGAIVCQLDVNNQNQIVGWCDGSLLRAHLPDDLGGRSEWTTARVFLDDHDLVSDFPDLENGPA